MEHPQPQILPAVLLGAALIPAVVWDLKYRRIPNLITLPLATLALVLHTVFSGLEGLLFSGAGLLLGTALFLPVYILGGMGAGDAKLMGAVGAVLGAKGVLISAVLTALYGGLYALILLLLHPAYGRELLSRTWAVLKTFVLTRQYIPAPAPDSVRKKPRLCYGLAIALGVYTYLFIEYAGVEFL